MKSNKAKQKLSYIVEKREDDPKSHIYSHNEPKLRQ